MVEVCAALIAHGIAEDDAAALLNEAIGDFDVGNCAAAG